MSALENKTIIERVRAERKAEREEHLGPHALSVVPMYFQDIAPKGWDVVHISGDGPYTVDERGMVHFPEPVRAFVSERVDMSTTFRPKKIVKIPLPPDRTSFGFNGNFFIPRISERESALYKELEEYMPELIMHRDWRNHPLPGRKNMRSLTEGEQSAWDSWMRIEKGRDPEGDTLRWPRKVSGG